MEFYLLDGAGAGLLIALFGIGILFLLLAIALEAVIMQRMKYQFIFRVSLIQSTVANLVSLASGFVLSSTADDFFAIDNYAGLAVLFAVTVLLEFLVLYLMNRKQPVKRSFIVSLVMNLVTYAIAAIITLIINS
ncbi:MAG: hypothetical protein ACT4OJ_02750 [Bacteroidota bacterium]